jgi:hypothetical protein
MSRDDSQPERSPDIRELTDARTLRALTHPVRVAMLEELIHGGAMTATELGERIGETPDHVLLPSAPAGQVRLRRRSRRRPRPVKALAADEYRLVVHPRR